VDQSEPVASDGFRSLNPFGKGLPLRSLFYSLARRIARAA
jgi:hypothetical protein